MASRGQLHEASPGGRPGKTPFISKYCADGLHRKCVKDDCACTACGHPPPIVYAKKSAKRDLCLESIQEGLAI
jgi:hypothetical protein